MTETLKLVQPIRDDTVPTVIDWAKEQDFETVVVIGWKGSMCTCRSSKVVNFAEKVGALEYAKALILRPDDAP